ncbi:TLC domain-containing protein At5g14285-like [Impatiens glandulifera]|uniref:TLC domain-containing protein At5g14285-like n=1 Tax=Impatiens glandulifera TaxID=253017 RepID=UPI001FB0D4BD|nr:TLC domain-containing protein At5g14285-like [Impatiens glandulifera]
MDISNLQSFILVFTSIYLTGYFTIFRQWKAKHRAEASSTVMSLFHGTPAVILAIKSIMISQTQLDLASKNTAFQNTVLEFSIAYFIADLLHYILFIPTDFLYIAHHLATLHVFLTCRYAVGHGAHAVLVLLVLAESTSACQNVWCLVGYRREDCPAAEKVYRVLSPAFYLFYSVMRGVLGPAFVCKMLVFYLSGKADGLIPMWAWVSWMVVIVGAILVSILWVLNLWMVLFRDRRRKQLMKSN